MMHSLLTKREKEIFTLLIQSYTTKEIAKQLYISEKTVRNHISNVIQKLIFRNQFLFFKNITICIIIVEKG